MSENNDTALSKALPTTDKGEKIEGKVPPELLAAAKEERRLEAERRGQVPHEKLEEALSHFIENLNKAAGKGRFMAVCFSAEEVEKGKILTTLEGRTTFDFPRASFETCLQLLSNDIMKEVNPPVPERLPFAVISEETGEWDEETFYGGTYYEELGEEIDKLEGE